MILTLFTDLAIAEPPQMDWQVICQYDPYLTDSEVEDVLADDGYFRTNLPTADEVNAICENQ